MNLRDKIFMIAIVVVGVLYVGAKLTRAQESGCFPSQDWYQLVTGPEWAESRQMIMLTEDGLSMIEIFANTDTGTWTALRTTVDGVSCMIGGGPAFVNNPPQPVIAPTGEDS